MASENKSAYFPLLSDLASNNIISSDNVPQKIYNSVFELVSQKGYLSSNLSMALVKAELSLHFSTPAIEAYYHYYNNTVLPAKHDNGKFDPSCEIWAEVNGQQACDVKTLKKLVKETSKSPSADSSLRLLPFDHVHKTANVGAEETPVVVLYADITSKDFSAFHAYLSSQVNSGSLSYVLRYKPPTEKGQNLYLSGYGVELALKNTDYLVIDDQNVEGMVNLNGLMSDVLHE